MAACVMTCVRTNALKWSVAWLAPRGVGGLSGTTQILWILVLILVLAPVGSLLAVKNGPSKANPNHLKWFLFVMTGVQCRGVIEWIDYFVS